MADKLRDQMLAVINNIENMKPPAKDDVQDYSTGLAQGHFDGMTSTAAQFKALLSEKARKPLVRNAYVLIKSGPYADQKGYFQGLTHSPTGVQAEVMIEGVDLPVLTSQEDLEVL